MVMNNKQHVLIFFTNFFKAFMGIPVTFEIYFNFYSFKWFETSSNGNDLSNVYNLIIWSIHIHTLFIRFY